MQQHLAEHSIAVDHVTQSELNSLGIIGTPTVLIVDSHGVVQRAFLGKLVSRDEQEVLSILERGAV
jgi:hypothetical protein